MGSLLQSIYQQVTLRLAWTLRRTPLPSDTASHFVYKLIGMTTSQRTTAIATAVLLLHGGGLWALQSGMLRRAVEVVVPAELLSQIIEPPKPLPQKLEPPPTPPPPKLAPKPQAAVQPKQETRASTPSSLPAPQPVAIADPTTAANAPTGVTAPQPSAPPAAAPVTAPPPAPPPAPPAPVKIELPSSDADYLNNPKPAYPLVSKRLGEQGTVIVRVLIGADGGAQKAELKISSGFERLDQAAINTVLKWRFIPGKRGGAPETMWFNVPLNFVLE